MFGLDGVDAQIILYIVIGYPSAWIISAAFHRNPTPILSDCVKVPVASVEDKQRVFGFDFLGQIAQGAKDVLAGGIFVVEFNDMALVEGVAFHEDTFKCFCVVDGGLQSRPRKVGIDANREQPLLPFYRLTSWGDRADSHATVVLGQGRDGQG